MRDERTPETRAPDIEWHLDKRVPVSIIIMLMVQTAGVVWWAARAESRIEAQAERLAVVERHADAARDLRLELVARLTRIETILERIEHGLSGPDRASD